MTPRLIKSFFAGKCRTCGKTTPKGEQVWFAKHYGIRCQACGPHTSADAPIPSRKGKGKRRSVPTPSISAPTVAPSQSQISPRATGFAPMYTPASATTRLAAEAGPDRVFRLGWSCITDVVNDAFTHYGQTSESGRMVDDVHARHNGDRWANGHDEASLRKAVHEPAGELLETIEEMRTLLVDELALPLTTRRKVRRGLDWGDELDADRYLQREPNAWERSLRDPITRRSVTIGINLTVFARQDADELLYRGAAAVALADLLTQRGINVRLIGFSVGDSCSSTVQRLVSMIELKAADMPLDVASLATAVCDVGFFRMAVMPAEFRHLTGELSTCLGSRDGHLPGPDRMALDYLVESHVTTCDAAVAWLREQLAAGAEVSRA